VGKTLTAFRLDDELLERIDKAADKGNRSRFIVMACEAALRGLEDSNEEVADVKPFRCPDDSCGMRARSVRAVCPTHGRAVVKNV
jgi:hypothetical protein